MEPRGLRAAGDRRWRISGEKRRSSGEASRSRQGGRLRGGPGSSGATLSPSRPPPTTPGFSLKFHQFHKNHQFHQIHQNNKRNRSHSRSGYSTSSSSLNIIDDPSSASSLTTLVSPTQVKNKSFKLTSKIFHFIASVYDSSNFSQPREPEMVTAYNR